MASHNDGGTRVQYGASDIARLTNGSPLPARAGRGEAAVSRRLSLKQTDATLRAERARINARVIVCVFLLVVIAFLSLGVMGAMGQNYPFVGSYALFTPVEVAQAIYEHGYNALGQLTHAWSPHTNEWLAENMPWYWAVWHRLGVVGITLLCGILLSVSGMLYQCVFRNPLAGPGMLGAGSGVSLGMLLLVVLFGTDATAMLQERYMYCYGLGVAVLVFVIIAGKRLSGRGKPFDIVTMLLIGSIFGQLAGFVQQYVVLFLYGEDEAIQNVFIELNQMLVVDTSALSWICLGVAFAVSFIPIYFMRFRMNA